MKREIKFRAWNRIVCRWQYFNLADLENQKGRIQWQNLDITQFTGLKDKKEKEIYEGDVVQAVYNHHGRPTDITFKAKIIYNSDIGSFQISYLNGNYEFVNDTIWLKYFLEVIGNIYENPELLKS